MDAEKSFDRVSWVYMAELLCGFGLGEQILGWILALYRYPQARVKVNGVLSDQFAIRNETRHDCPLSPLLFALVLEPFLRRVHGHTDISGINIGSAEHKVSAYADDLLFYPSKPHISLPVLMSELHQFG